MWINTISRDFKRKLAFIQRQSSNMLQMKNLWLSAINTREDSAACSTKQWKFCGVGY